MATKLQWSKSGLKLLFDVSAQPTPRIQQAYPLPDIPIQTAQMLDAVLESIADAGRMGIRVTYRGTGDLPGTAAAVFSVVHVSVQDSISASEELAVSGRTVNILLDQPLPSALHSFSLKRVDAGQTTIWPAVTLTTPADLTIEIANGGLVSGPNLIPNGDSELGVIAGIGGNLVYDAGSGNGFNGSRYVRSTKLGRQGSHLIRELITVKAGEIYKVTAELKQQEAGTYDAAFIMVQFLKADRVTAAAQSTQTAWPAPWELGQWYSIGGEDGPYFLPPLQFTIPKDCAFITLSLEILEVPDGDYWWDNLVCSKQTPIATTASAGTVIVGDGLSVTDEGVIALDAPLATVSTPGTVLVGTGLKVSSSGVLEVDPVALPSANNNYDLNTSVSGYPAEGLSILKVVATRAFSVLATGHQMVAGVLPTAAAIFTVRKTAAGVVSTVGTLSIDPTGAVTLTGFIGATSFAIGNVLEITAPSTLDLTLQDVAITLLGSC